MIKEQPFQGALGSIFESDPEVLSKGREALINLFPQGKRKVGDVCSLKVQGFPVKVISELSSADGAIALNNVTLASLKVGNMANLILELNKQGIEELDNNLKLEVAGDIEASGVHEIKIQSDGSCMFNAIGRGLQLAGRTRDDEQAMRENVAAALLSTPEVYTPAFLGKDPFEYAAWITEPAKHWGGVPELSVLSEFYEVELCVVDIGAEKLEKFRGPGNRS
eukprot:CAMPEP_0170495166 /NCGR_PEP_ID=MMETSP0208-20121228/15055_1 /TAXON_ID=197538 /ORGANISM="Strombidium inclinatum, Strain S3" /LENGTH=221 /DNA_ID=CAMNT_0010771319 /DNA_START=112 /DNA_END=777 /DNA_ORIENTATION=+